MSDELHTFASPPTPFTIDFAQSDLDKLHRRIDETRWPDVDVYPNDLSPKEVGAQFGLGKGPTLELMKEVAKEWRQHDWKKTQDKYNTFNHFKVDIEGLDIHFLHHKSERQDALPILLAHGWPGHFGEFLDMIPLLTSPPSQTQQAFHVVVPSQPGFAFSSPAKTHSHTMDDTARIFDKLMTGLGYERYAAQGGDWGAVTVRCLGALYPQRCKAVHLNFCPAADGGPSITGWVNPRTLLSWLPRFVMPDLDRERLQRALQYKEQGSAYYAIQNLTPRTPAYALHDSPIGLLAWLTEKFESFIQLAAQRPPSVDAPKPTLTREILYETATLYWLTNSIGTSFSPYSMNQHYSDFLKDPRYHLPNFGLSIFPWEIAIVPKKWVESTGNLKWYKEHDNGGHFAAIENPHVLAEHVREAMAVMWDK